MKSFVNFITDDTYVYNKQQWWFDDGLGLKSVYLWRFL